MIFCFCTLFRACRVFPVKNWHSSANPYIPPILPLASFSPRLRCLCHMHSGKWLTSSCYASARCFRLSWRTMVCIDRCRQIFWHCSTELPAFPAATSRFIAITVAAWTSYYIERGNARKSFHNLFLSAPRFFVPNYMCFHVFVKIFIWAVFPPDLPSYSYMIIFVKRE